MNNSKRINNKNQEILKGFLLSQEFVTDPESFFEKMSKAERTAFDRLIVVWKKEGNRFSLSNQRLADLMGCSSATVNRWKARWIKHGLLTSEAVYVKLPGQPTLQKPNYYSISPYFKCEDSISTLGHLLPSLKLLALALLTVFGSHLNPSFLDKQYYNRVNIRRDIKNFNINNTALAWRIAERSGRMGLALNDVIPFHVRCITELKLTPAGQMRLSAYPGAAITYARNGIRRTKKFIKNPFAYFVALCEQYCKECDIKPDWRLLELTQKVFGWKSDEPMLKSLAVNAKIPCKTPSTINRPMVPTVHQGIPKQEQRTITSPVYESITPERLSIETSNLEMAQRFPFMQYKDLQSEKRHNVAQNHSSLKRPEEVCLDKILPAHKQYSVKPIHNTKSLQFLQFCGLTPENLTKESA